MPGMSVTPVCDINDFLAFQLGARGNRRSALAGEGKTKGMVVLPQPPPPLLVHAAETISSQGFGK